MLWKRLYNVASVASLIQWLLTLGAVLVSGGGLAAFVSIAAEAPTATVVIVGVGAAMLVLGLIAAALARKTPLLSVEAHVEAGMGVLDGELHHIAGVVVKNALDAGGERLAARRVVPEVEILEDDGERVFRNVGWDTTNARDFFPSGEEHVLWIAEKWHESQLCTAVSGEPSSGDFDVTGPRLWGEAYKVRLVLRANNLRRPMRRELTLLNQRPKGGLRLNGAHSV